MLGNNRLGVPAAAGAAIARAGGRDPPAPGLHARHAAPRAQHSLARTALNAGGPWKTVSQREGRGAGLRGPVARVQWPEPVPVQFVEAVQLAGRSGASASPHGIDVGRCQCSSQSGRGSQTAARVGASTVADAPDWSQGSDPARGTNQTGPSWGHGLDNTTRTKEPGGNSLD